MLSADVHDRAELAEAKSAAYPSSFSVTTTQYKNKSKRNEMYDQSTVSHGN